MATHRKHVDLSVGTVEYVDAGQGAPVVLLHGALSNLSTWGGALEHMARRVRCVAPTLPLGGHRLALDPGANLTPPGIADLVLEFVDALGLDAFTLVGNDTGGAYAQVFAAAHPDRVSRLVLSNCDALDVFPPTQFAALQTAINLPLYPGVMALAFRVRPFLTSRWALGLLSHRLTGVEIRDAYVRPFIDDAGVRSDFRKVVNGWSTRYTTEAADRLASLGIPTLLLWGGDDEVLFPLSLAERLQARLPTSRLEVVEGARTYVHVDRPEAFAEGVVGFATAPA